MTIACVLIFILTARARSGGGSTGRAADTVYFFDLNTEELFSVPHDAVPPIEAPSNKAGKQGRAGVLAHVFSCGSCEDESQHYVGWFETTSPQRIPRRANGPRPPETELPLNFLSKRASGFGGLVAQVGHDAWYPFDNKAAARIKDEALSRCGQERRPKRCAKTLRESESD